MRTTLSLLLTSLLVSTLPAQMGPDAKDQIKRIADKVAEEMKEIDRLLNSRDPSSMSSDAARRAAEGIQKMLDQAQSTNKRVQQGIEELLEQMKPQQGGQGQGEEQQDQQQQQQQQGARRDQNSPREENQTPEMMQQQQQGQQQQQQQGQPRDPGQNPQQAQNRPAQKPPGEDGKEVVERAGDVGSWGNLPDYLGAIKQRGGVPEVSEKYRKLYDAYLKAQAKKPGQATPARR